MKIIKMHMPKGTSIKKTKKIAITLLLFIFTIVILYHGITAYIYEQYCKYREKKRENNK